MPIVLTYDNTSGPPDMPNISSIPKLAKHCQTLIFILYDRHTIVKREKKYHLRATYSPKWYFVFFIVRWDPSRITCSIFVTFAFLSALTKRQRRLEFYGASILTDGSDFTAVRFYDGFHDGKSNAAAARLGITRTVRTIEALK